MLDILENLFDSWKSHAQRINNVGDCVKCIDIQRDGRYLKGILKKGTTGPDSDIEDLEKRMVIHTVTENQVVLSPYYFIFYVPEDQQKAICLFQRTGNSSLHKLIEYLIKFFSENFDPYKIEINYVYQRDVLDEIMMSNSVSEVRLTQYKWSPDPVDNIFGPTDQPLTVVVSYRSKGGTIPLTKAFKELFTGKAKPSDIIEHDIKADEVTIVAKVGKKRKQSFTFAEEKDARFRPYRDITKELVAGPDNHPTFDSVDVAAREYLTELSKSIYEIPNS